MFLSLQWSVTASPSVTGWTGLTSIILLSVKQSDNVTSEYVLEDGPGYKRLVENSEHCLTDVKRPQLPHKIERALVHPVEWSCAFNPVQFIVSVYSEVFIVLHTVYTVDPLHKTGFTGFLVLLKSTVTSLVFVTLSCRLFCSHHETKSEPQPDTLSHHPHR